MVRKLCFSFVVEEPLVARTSAVPVCSPRIFGDSSTFLVASVVKWHVHKLKYGRADLLTEQKSAQPCSNWHGVKESTDVVGLFFGCERREVELVVWNNQSVGKNCGGIGRNDCRPERAGGPVAPSRQP